MDGLNERGDTSIFSSAKALAVAVLLVLVCLAFAGSLIFFLAQDKPHHARRDAVLHQLPIIASDVNAYRKLHGSLPKSLQDVGVTDEHFRLVRGVNAWSFLVVWDYVDFLNDDGSRFHYACNEKLEIQKLPANEDGDSGANRTRPKR
jgi:hypothetical protein